MISLLSLGIFRTAYKVETKAAILAQYYILQPDLQTHTKFSISNTINNTVKIHLRNQYSPLNLPTPVVVTLLF